MKERTYIKQLIKSLNSTQNYLLKIQVEREKLSSSLQNLIAHLTPIFLSIFNCSYTLQSPFFQGTRLSILFNIFLYLSPDHVSTALSSPEIFLISTYILVALPALLTLLQIYYLKYRNYAASWLTFSINITFLVTFRLLLLPTVNILLWSIKSAFFSSLIPGSVSEDFGLASLFFFLLLTIETFLFLLYFNINSHKDSKKHFFACSNLTGEVGLIINCYLMGAINNVIDGKDVWQNLIRSVFYGSYFHTVMVKQPYYSQRTNTMLCLSYMFSFIVSIGYLVAFNIDSPVIVVYLIIFVSPPALFLVYIFLVFRCEQIKKLISTDIEFEWQVDFAAKQFVNQYEEAKKSRCPAETTNKICSDFENFCKENIKIPVPNLILINSLFYICLDKPERAYYNLFFYNNSERSIFRHVQMKKIELIVNENKILEHFYSEYFVLTSKCKKYDYLICSMLLSLCSELHKNYPSLGKIIKKLRNLMKVLEKSLKTFSALMKDFQTEENLELYGSFLINILSDSKGQKYLNLSKNLTTNMTKESETYWLLDKNTGICIFSASFRDYGRIIEHNQAFIDILHITLDSLPENLLDLIYGPFKKYAHELFAKRIQNMNEFELLKDCFKCFVDIDDFFIEVELYLMPICWEGTQCLVLAVKPIDKIQIVLHKNFQILNVSKNFVNKILGSNNKSSLPLLLNKKLTYFLPNFASIYRENSEFFYEIGQSSGFMQIATKSFKYNYNEYIFVSVLNYSKVIFRQNSVMETIKRKHSLTIIQISEKNAVSRDSIIEKTKNVFIKESTVESKRYDYEPDSFDIKKRAGQANTKIFSVFTTRKLLIKVLLGVIYLISVFSMIGGLYYLIGFIRSLSDSNIIGQYADMLSKVQEIVIDTRMLQLIETGSLSAELKPAFKSSLNTSTYKLNEILHNISSVSLIQNNNIYKNNVVDLVHFQGTLATHTKTSLQDALRQFISHGMNLINSESWQENNFLFLYINGHSTISSRFIESLNQLIEEFDSSKKISNGLMILIFTLPQTFVFLVMLLTLFPQLIKLGRSYKEILKEITRLKKEKLVKISLNAVKRLKITHHVVKQVKDTNRNRKPKVQKKWKISAIFFTLALSLYILVSNLCLTVPASNLSSTLSIYTSKSLMTLTYYVYSSFFWTIENYFSNYPSVAYQSIFPGFQEAANFGEKVYEADKAVLKMLNDLRSKITYQDALSFLLTKNCTQPGCFSNFGLYLKLKDMIYIHEFSLTMTYIEKSKFMNHTEYMTTITKDINMFRSICRAFTDKILSEYNFIAIGVVLNLAFGISLVLVYSLHLRKFLDDIALFVTFRIFYNPPETNHINP